MDCPGSEDEEDCESYQCPGYYRCRDSHICLHPSHLCDKYNHCPQQDDQRFCHIHCPKVCTCQGFEFTCKTHFNASSFPLARYIDASNSDMTLDMFRHNYLLIHLNLSYCRLSYLNSNSSLSNLFILDLSYNLLTEISIASILNIQNLRALILSWNPISKFLQPQNMFLDKTPFSKVIQMEAKGLHINYLDFEIFDTFPEIHFLDISYGKYTEITSLSSFKKLRNIIMLGNKLEKFPPDLYRGLQQLNLIKTSIFKLCCPQLFSDQIKPKECLSVDDDFSSCDNLLRSESYRLFLWLFAIFSFLGNLGSLSTRFYLQGQKAWKSAFAIFVTNLSIADFCMGIYLLIIGSADKIYEGSYVWQDISWKHSFLCQT